MQVQDVLETMEKIQRASVKRDDDEWQELRTPIIEVNANLFPSAI